MERTARRAAWALAALLTAAGVTWIARTGRDGAVVRDAAQPVPDARDATAPPAPDAPVAARRHERRRTRTESSEPPGGDGSESRTIREVPVPDPPRAEGRRRLLADEAVRANLRPAAGAVDPKTVLARDWTPAKDSLAAATGRRPNTAAARDPDPSPERADPEDAETAELAKTHGLRGDYYDYLDGWITEIPDVASLPPTFSRIDLALDFDTDASFALPFTADTFAVRWTGSLRVPEEGAYRFTCGSDDGARIRIDGAAVLEHATLRPYAESGGAVKLTAGVHPIEVVFYENYGYASCRLWWDGPGWKRRLVAPEFLTPPAELANVTPPHIASIAPASGFVEDEVTIRGAGFAGAASRVTFHGVPAEVVSGDAGRLVVKVPIGAATGDVVVQSGAISSLPRRFEVRNLLGLYAEYFKFDGELRDYPDFDHLAPFFVRLDESVDFLEDDLWDLPYDSDVFAARHAGFLYVPADDEYRITLGSDDGARVALDGKTLVEIPGLHPYAEQSRTVRLAAGFHAIEGIFFENYGAARLALFWQRPSEPTRSVIPAGFFYAPRELSDLPTPVVASVAPRAAEIRGDVEIRGSGFGTNERLVRVVFPGDVWVRPTTVDDDRIRVRVPYGAESGDLRVEVGIQRSNRVAFAVATPLGLAADYLTFNDRASLDAAIADLSVLSKPASFTRTETSWQRTSAKDWALPFAMPTFAVHWHGTLAVEYPADIDWILRAAAGAYLLVDDQLAVDCGPWHELEERYGRSHLTPGEHRFDLWLVQSGAEPRIQLLYTPTGRLEHLPVPARWFQPREKR